METTITPIAIPVPPAPLLEQAVGYRNTKNARYLALWWEPCGDEAMVSDGPMTFTGCWPGYLAYVQHPTVNPSLAIYNLGSSEEMASHRLVIDLIERLAYIATSQEAEHLLAAQWDTKVEGPVILTLDQLEGLLASLSEQWSPGPSLRDLMAQITKDNHNVAVLRGWLDRQDK